MNLKKSAIPSLQLRGKEKAKKGKSGRLTRQAVRTRKKKVAKSVLEASLSRPTAEWGAMCQVTKGESAEEKVIGNINMLEKGEIVFENKKSVKEEVIEDMNVLEKGEIVFEDLTSCEVAAQCEMGTETLRNCQQRDNEVNASYVEREDSWKEGDETNEFYFKKEFIDDEETEDNEIVPCPTSNTSTVVMKEEVILPDEVDIKIETFTSEDCDPFSEATECPQVECYNTEDQDNSSQVNEKKKMYKHIFNCLFCDESFVKSSDCKNHIKRYHTSKGSVKCHFCDDLFVTAQGRKRHESRSHTNEKPFQCQFCDKSFVTGSECNLHERRYHTGEKPFKCQFCCESFFEHSSRLRHERRNHTGEKPFKCQFCEKSFFSSSERTWHVRRSHIRERPFKCQFCDGSFTRSDNLKDHEWKHTGDKPFKCQFCDKTFVRSRESKRHEERHRTNEVRFKCQECGMPFLLLKDCRSHEKKHNS